MPFPHRLACPHAGHWHLLFTEKSNQKLSPAHFAMKGSTFTFIICTAKVKGEKSVQFGFVLSLMGALCLIILNL